MICKSSKRKFESISQVGSSLSFARLTKNKISVERLANGLRIAPIKNPSIITVDEAPWSSTHPNRSIETPRRKKTLQMKAKRDRNCSQRIVQIYHSTASNGNFIFRDCDSITFYLSLVIHLRRLHFLRTITL